MCNRREPQSVFFSFMVITPDSRSCTLLPLYSCSANAIAAYTSLFVFPIIISFYIGILPCFFAGRPSRFVASCAKARQMRKRVLRGSITSSI